MELIIVRSVRSKNQGNSNSHGAMELNESINNPMK
jgi:hypothetical protein